MFRLPDPLNPRSLRRLMDDPRYLDDSHPEHQAYARLIRTGFERLYPGPYVPGSGFASDRAEGGPDGVVHVRGHTREQDGQTVQVSPYERAAPGTGSPHTAAESRPDLADSKSPIPNPRIRNDGAGSGHFGADRKRPDGTKYPHQGVDILAAPGTQVTSPADGEIKVTSTYRDGRYGNEFKTIWITQEDGTSYGLGYVAPTDRNGQPMVKDRDNVKAGDPIGTVQDRARKDPSGKMNNHIHVEIKDQAGKNISPVPTLKGWQK